MMERYREYKDSGVKWLGKIPSHWEVKRLANFFSERREKVSDQDYAPLSVTKQGIFPQLDNVAKTNDGDNRKLVKRGDFVINSRSDRKGSSGVSELDGSVSLINLVLQPRKTLFGPFCNYLLKSYGFIEENYKNGRGIVADLWTTRYDEMKMIKVALPSLEEQKTISSYLDSATSEIDKAIAMQQKMIDLLNERKQIIIQNAVTKGLDENVEMKESGVEWIEYFPAKWVKKRLKNIVDFISDKIIANKQTNNISLENIVSHSGEYVKTDSEYEGIGVRFSKDDILFGKLRPYLAKVHLCKYDGVALGDIYVLRCHKNFDAIFLRYLLLSDKFIQYVNSSTYGTKMPRANWSFIGNICLAYPTYEEQIRIGKYIDERMKKIDTAITNCQRQITLLQERKQIIINEVVTGKVRVS